MSFNSKDHHNIGEIRPRFKLVSSMGKDEIFENIENNLKTDKTVCVKRVYNQYYLDIPINERLLWSPELRISIDEEDDDYTDQSLIRVLVGPQAKVWSSFVVVCIFILGFSFFAGLYGIAQIRLGVNPIWLWISALGILIFLSTYIFAKIGQRSTRNQTLHLVSSLYHAVGFDNVTRVEE